MRPDDLMELRDEVDSRLDAIRRRLDRVQLQVEAGEESEGRLLAQAASELSSLRALIHDRHDLLLDYLSLHDQALEAQERVNRRVMERLAELEDRASGAWDELSAVTELERTNEEARRRRESLRPVQAIEVTVNVPRSDKQKSESPTSKQRVPDTPAARAAATAAAVVATLYALWEALRPYLDAK